MNATVWMAVCRSFTGSLWSHTEEKLCCVLVRHTLLPPIEMTLTCLAFCGSGLRNMEVFADLEDTHLRTLREIIEAT